MLRYFFNPLPEKDMSRGKLAQFDNQNYLNLESFRKNGQGVQTPIWFAEGDGVFYAYTLASSFKVSRIRNNSRVRIAPCDIRGNVTGEWVEANARILDESHDSRVHLLLNKKYGLIKWVFDVMNRVRGGGRVSLAIELS